MATSVSARLSVPSFAARSMEKSTGETSTVSYAPTVLEALRRVAQAAFDADQAPIFGLLLGRHTPLGLLVTAWLPATSLQTGRDANLGRALELARLEYPTEQPIGWFRSKHQGEPRLSTEELESAGALIPGGWPLTLVLRPSSQRPLRLSAYRPQADAPLAGERPSQEFYVHPNQLSAAPAPFLEPSLSQSKRPNSVERFRASVEKLRWAFPAGLLVLVAIAAIGTAQLNGDDPLPPFSVVANTNHPAPAKPSPEPLRVSADGNHWIVRWDPRAAADRATLAITRDGRRETVTLTPSQYREGSYRMPHSTSATPDTDVEIVLRSQANQGALEIRTRIVNTATTLPPARKQAAVSAELDKVKLELQAERARRQRLMEMFDAQTKSANLP